MSTNKQQNKDSRKGYKQRPGKEDFKPKSEKGGFKPRSEKGSFKSKSEKGGFKSWSEKEGLKPKSDREDFKPRSEKGSFKSKSEKGGFKSWSEKKGFKPKSEKEGFKPRAEKGSFKSRPEKRGLKPWLDTEGLRPKPESGGLDPRTKPVKLKKRPGKTQKNRSENSPSKPGSVAQKDYLRDEIRLNKYISHSGFCSRREADEFITNGEVRVNGKVVTELGIKVKASDRVEVGRQSISLEPFVYILLNKGRDTISTTSDEKDRNTVLDVVEDSTGHRVYPVGRLDRNTMGLIILTNDGDLAHRLMHPSYKVKKTYEVTTNPPLSDNELEQYRDGIVLEDGPVKAAKVKRVAGDPDSVSISVVEGRNHLIRRMAAHFGAEVIKLKRVRYAGLSDKDLRVGRWRYLKQKEINDLRKLVKLDKLDFNKGEL
jgi:23S rRNA pseudouridine2605 synthase